MIVFKVRLRNNGEKTNIVIFCRASVHPLTLDFSISVFIESTPLTLSLKYLQIIGLMYYVTIVIFIDI